MSKAEAESAIVTNDHQARVHPESQPNFWQSMLHALHGVKHILDLIDIRENPRIKLIKDMSAGAVLVAASAAMVVGVAIFVPHLVRKLWAS
jgi:hypothetical protein